MSYFETGKEWTAATALKEITRLFAPGEGEGEARAMARLIFHHLKGWSVTDLIINSDTVLSDFILGKLDDIVSRVLAGEPVQYVLGEARFYGMDLRVTPDVLIPRQETEELVDMIVKGNEASDLRVLDVGTGSGAIAIALSRNLRFPEITAIDISPAALEVARANAASLHAHVRFVESDVFTYEPEPESFDIIVSNPPYVAESEKKDMSPNVLGHEPALALFVSDSEPLIYYSRIAGIAAGALVPGGKLYFEINPLFVAGLRELLEAEGFADIKIIDDISHRPRFAVAVRTN